MSCTGMEFGQQQLISLWENQKNGSPIRRVVKLQDTKYPICHGQQFGYCSVVSPFAILSQKDYKTYVLVGDHCSIRFIAADNLMTYGGPTLRMKHDEIDHWLYSRFASLNSRCYRKKDARYKTYGARGIKCEFRNYLEFREECEKLPNFSKEFEIDRIDNNGNYAAGNIRFVTKKENAGNKTTTVYTDTGRPVYEFIEELRKTNSDLSYQAVYRYISLGHTEECIRNRKKGERIRHCKCRA